MVYKDYSYAVLYYNQIVQNNANDIFFTFMTADRVIVKCCTGTLLTFSFARYDHREPSEPSPPLLLPMDFSYRLRRKVSG